MILVGSFTASGWIRLILGLFVDRLHRLVCRLEDEIVEHELIGVELF